MRIGYVVPAAILFLTPTTSTALTCAEFTRLNSALPNAAGAYLRSLAEDIMHSRWRANDHMDFDPAVVSFDTLAFTTWYCSSHRYTSVERVVTELLHKLETRPARLLYPR
jgi:hypothetical protein